MLPLRARDSAVVFSTVTGVPNPSELHTLTSPPLPVGYTLWGSSSGELNQDEAFYALQYSSHVRQKVMVAELGENTALSFASPPLNNVTPSHPEQKLLSGKQFPFKLYLMLEDETVEPYVKWSRTEYGDAFLIPDTEAFVANVMPKHFKEMKQWNSFQKQLNNYGFEKQGRGQGKALYIHSGNKFCKGRPDLLHEVLRRPHWQIDATSPESGSQTDPYVKNNHIEHQNEQLKKKILGLEREFEERQSKMEDRRRTAENQLQIMEQRLLGAEGQRQITQQRLLEMENQLLELSKRLEGASIRDGALNSVVNPGLAQPVDNFDALYNALSTPAAADSWDPTDYSGSLQGDSFESYLSTEMTYGPVDPPRNRYFGL